MIPFGTIFKCSGANLFRGYCRKFAMQFASVIAAFGQGAMTRDTMRRVSQDLVC